MEDVAYKANYTWVDKHFHAKAIIFYTSHIMKMFTMAAMEFRSPTKSELSYPQITVKCK